MNKIEKTIEYGLYVLVFLLPFQTRWIFRQGAMAGWPYEFGTLSLYATDFLLVILLTLNAYAKINLRKNGEQKDTRISLVWWLIGGVELMTFISIFLAFDKTIAWQVYLRLLLGIGLFWLVVSAKYDLQKLLNVFIASATVQSLLGIWQFLTQAISANKILGIAKHLPIDIGDSVITAANGVRWLRAYGSFDHPNIFGGVMALTLLIMLMKKYKTQSAEMPAHVSSRSIFYYLIIIILTCGLFFSFSRAAWIGFGTGLIIFSWLFFLKKRASVCSPSVKIFISSGVPLIAFILLSTLYSNLISVRTLNNTVTENKSISDRLSAYKIDIEMLKDNWLLGVGAGNYGLAVKNKFNDLDYNGYQPIHNVYLLIYSEIGIIGFVCFCSLFIYFVSRQLRREDIYGVAIITSVLIMFMFDHWWWSLHVGILFLFLICGILAKKENLHV